MARTCCLPELANNPVLQGLLNCKELMLQSRIGGGGSGTRFVDFPVSNIDSVPTEG